MEGDKMVLVILGICILILIIGVILVNTSINFEEVGIILTITSILGIGVSLIVAILLGIKISQTSTIDTKIEMYNAENTKIENQVANIVSKYQEYEEKTFEKVTPEDSMTLVSLYPELKSDKLVQEQIKVYINNNNKIKELKEKQINGKVHKWWLYFGGK